MVLQMYMSNKKKHIQRFFKILFLASYMLTNSFRGEKKLSTRCEEI